MFRTILGGIIGSVLTLTLLMIAPTRMMAAQNVWDFPLGLGYVNMQGNELLVASTVDDPAKVRFAATHGSGLGAWSWNRLQPGGRQEEVVMVKGGIDERYRCDPNNFSGEFTIFISDGANPDADKRMKRKVEIRHDGVWFDGQPYPSQWYSTNCATGQRTR